MADIEWYYFMAVKNKMISNPGSGQTIRFIQTSRDTSGKLLEMESTYAPHSLEPVEHYHPLQEEEFTVEEGSISVRINGGVRILHQEDKLVIPANTVHSMWNHSDSISRVNWIVRPALNTEYLLETGMGLAADGKVNAKGLPSILQTALLMNKYRQAFRLAKIPYMVQRILFGLLSPFAMLAGYRSVYQKYID
ncbi:MAG TPA: cupin domain-containing protein [Chitinophagaceae bacterium]|nr:cupin domain-containing protein [Chitinophagaceae bacterium]